MRNILFVVAILSWSSGAAAQQASMSLEPDTDRPGQNLRVLDLENADPSLCAQACVAEARCLSFTYVKPGIQGPKARCWLKSGTPPATSSSCCVSGVKTAGVAQRGTGGPTQVSQGEAKTPPKPAPGTPTTLSTGGQITQTSRASVFSSGLLSCSLEVGGLAFGRFATCSGIGSVTEVAEQNVVDSQGQPVVKKMPGRLKWLDVTLKREFTADMGVWNWRQQVESGNVAAARKKVRIVLLDNRLDPVAEWELSNGWPSKVEVSMPDERLLIETVVITYEDMRRIR